MDQERDVGRLGEDFLDVWASAIGAIPHRVTHDKKGWDRLLEFTWNEFTGPIDRRPGTPRVFIQVKSTDDSKRFTWPVKLTNIESFIKEPAPTFFLLMQFDGKAQPQRAYLFHVDEALMRKGLEKMRKAAVENITKLHLEDVYITFSDEHVLEDTSGDGLLKAIKSAIGKNIHTYQEEKLKKLKELGYEGKKNQIKLSFKRDEHEDENYNPLAEIMLGKLNSIDEVEVEAFDTRFDMPIEDAELSSKNALIEFSLPHKDIDLEVRTVDGTDRVNFKGRLFSTLGLQDLIPKESHAFRITSRFFEAVAVAVNDKEFKLDFSFETTISYTLNEILQLSKLIEIFHTSFEGQESVEFYMGEPIEGIATLNPRSVIDTYLSSDDVQTLLSVFVAVAKHAGVELTELTTIKAIAGQHSKSNLIATLLRGESLSVNYEFDLPDHLDSSQPCIAVLPLVIMVGETAVIGICLHKGNPISIGAEEANTKRYTINSSEITLALLKSIKRTSLTAEIIQNFQKRATKALEGEHNIIYPDEIMV